jgi:hypothetical protein
VTSIASLAFAVVGAMISNPTTDDGVSAAIDASIGNRLKLNKILITTEERSLRIEKI